MKSFSALAGCDGASIGVLQVAPKPSAKVNKILKTKNRKIMKKETGKKKGKKRMHCSTFESTDGPKHFQHQ